MRSVDYEIKFTGFVHSNQNQGVYLIKQCACWPAPYIVNKLNTTVRDFQYFIFICQGVKVNFLSYLNIP